MVVNVAIHRVVSARLRYDDRTKAYLQWHTEKDKITTEAILCLKRYVACEMLRILDDIGKIRVDQNA